MIGRERRGEGEGGPPVSGGTLVTEEVKAILQVPTPAGAFKLTGKKISLVIAIAVFIALLNTPVLPTVEANRCFAVLIFSTIMWATEVCRLHLVIAIFSDRLFKAIPLFVTSLLVPLLLVTLRVIRSENEEAGYPRLSSPEATKYAHFIAYRFPIADGSSDGSSPLCSLQPSCSLLVASP